jgi:non-heme chloroperoxidase
MERRRFLRGSLTAGATLFVAPALGCASAPHLDRRPTMTSNDLFYREWGHGRPVVFVHGWAVTSDVWQYVMVSLARRGARCIGYDKRGHGRSSHLGGPFTYDAFADDLASLLDALDLHDVTLVGHSMGPGEIVRYTSRHGSKRVSRLVLISSALPYMLKTADNPGGIPAEAFEERRKPWLQDMPAWLANNARAFVTPETSAETVAWLAEQGNQASLQALFETNHAIAETDLRGDVSRVALPTLLVHGDADKSAPLDLTTRRVATMIPNSQVTIYEGAPHGLPVTHAERLAGDIARWMQL